MGPDLLTPSSSPAQATHGDKARLKGADVRSGDTAMIRKWGKRATERFHRFYISSQVPKCLQETRSCRTIIRKKWKEEKGKGYKEESIDQKRRKKLKI